MSSYVVPLAMYQIPSKSICNLYASKSCILPSSNTRTHVTNPNPTFHHSIPHSSPSSYLHYPLIILPRRKPHLIICTQLARFSLIHPSPYYSPPTSKTATTFFSHASPNTASPSPCLCTASTHKSCVLPLPFAVPTIPTPILITRSAGLT